MKALLDRLRREGGEILATLEGLEEEVEELQGKGEKLRRGDLSAGRPRGEAAEAPPQLDAAGRADEARRRMR